MKDLYVILAVVLTMNTAYVDQLDTGSQGRYNCLPTSIEIASNILDKEFDTEKVREELGYNGDIFLPDIYPFIEQAGLKYDAYTLISSEEVLKKELDKGRLVVACLNNKKLKTFMDSNDSTRGIYYGEAYHSVLIKAYTDECFLIDDPFSMGRKRNGKYIGQNILVPYEYLVSKDIYYISLWK